MLRNKAEDEFCPCVLYPVSIASLSVSEMIAVMSRKMKNARLWPVTNTDCYLNTTNLFILY